MKELLKITADERGLYSSSFSRIADKLMNDYKLQVNYKFYRITECEFYFHDNRDHSDVYTHLHERQKSSIGEWYFHGSGLDITLAQDGGHGGVLIRSMVEVKTSIKVPRKEDTTKGPLNVCTTIFSEFGSVDNCNQQLAGIL